MPRPSSWPDAGTMLDNGAGPPIIKNNRFNVTRRRIDLMLVERGLFGSRARAQAAIEAGMVVADDKPVTKPSEPIAANAVLQAQPAQGMEQAHKGGGHGTNINGRKDRPAASRAGCAASGRAAVSSNPAVWSLKFC